MTVRSTRPERLVSVPEFARLRGVQYKTLWRTLRAIADADVRERGVCDWLFSLGRRKKIWVNLSRLERAHPALFHADFVSRDEFDSFQERVTDLETGQTDLRRRSNAIAGSVRDLRSELHAHLKSA